MTEEDRLELRAYISTLNDILIKLRCMQREFRELSSFIFNINMQNERVKKIKKALTAYKIDNFINEADLLLEIVDDCQDDLIEILEVTKESGEIKETERGQ